jgi:hypothetical protein
VGRLPRATSRQRCPREALLPFPAAPRGRGRPRPPGPGGLTGQQNCPGEGRGGAEVFVGEVSRATRLDCGTGEAPRVPSIGGGRRDLRCGPAGSAFDIGVAGSLSGLHPRRLGENTCQDTYGAVRSWALERALGDAWRRPAGPGRLRPPIRCPTWPRSRSPATRATAGPAEAPARRGPDASSNSASTPWGLPPAPPAISAPVAGAVVAPIHTVGTAPWPAIVSSAIGPTIEATVEQGRVGVYRRRYVDARRSHVDRWRAIVDGSAAAPIAARSWHRTKQQKRKYCSRTADKLSAHPLPPESPSRSIRQT